MARNREHDRTQHSAVVTKKSTAKVSGAEIEIKQEQEHIPVNDIQNIKHVARIAVTCGVTQKAENDFEFVRVDVTVDWPCAPNKEAADKCYKNVVKKVDRYIRQQIEEAQNMMK